jgi:hypothetical protein
MPCPSLPSSLAVAFGNNSEWLTSYCRLFYSSVIG